MADFQSQIKPLLLKQLWQTKHSPGNSIFCYIIVPIGSYSHDQCVISMALAFLVLSMAIHTGHTTGEPTTTHFNCGLRSDCIIGLASNYSVFVGSASSEKQQQVFAKWSRLVSTYYEHFTSQFVSFNSSAAMEAFSMENSNLVLGLVLDASRYPHHVSYDIRIGSTSIPAPILPSDSSLFFPAFAEILEGASAFVKSGFVSYQVASDAAIATIIANDDSLSASSTFTPQRTTFQTKLPLSISISSSPWPTSNLVSTVMLLIIPFCIGFAYLGASNLIAQSIVEDRVSKLKSYLKMMGMKESSYWISYFIWCCALFSLPCVFHIILGTSLGLFGKNILHGILDILLYGVSSVAFTMLVGSVAPSAKAASFIIMLYYCIPLFVLLFVNLALLAKLFLGILSSINFQFSYIQTIKEMALARVGYSRTMPAAIVAIPDYPTTPSIAMFAADSILYFLMAWYFGQILGESEEYGRSPKPWYFLFTRAYWSKLAKCDNSVDVPNDDDDFSLECNSLLMNTNTGPEDIAASSSRRDPDHFEAYPNSENNLRVRSRGLVKRFNGADENAVNGLDLDVPQGIYVLVGENGSGKSTTISMLTGLIPITSGTASIDGTDLATQMDQARSAISICPQHDMLSGNLTGSDHLRLFGRLKGVTDAELEARVPKLLTQVGLAGHENKLVSEYSGGMKRSLSLAISLVANSRIIFIDEVFSGMDVERRRSLWDLLLAKKNEGLTLVITTHSMEEAEILGDRIGILHRGALVREGTLAFFKRQLGFQIHTSGPNGPSTQFLPMSERNELSALVKSLGSTSSSISVTTPNLEDFFIQIRQSLDTATQDPAHLPKYYGEKAMDSSSHSQNPRPAPRLQQVSSLLKKKWSRETRRVGSWLVFLVLPLLLVAFGLSFSRISSGLAKQVPQAIASSQASDDPMSISVLRELSLDIPYATNSLIGSTVLNSMTSSEVKFSSIGKTVKDLSNFLWNGTDLPNAHLGGIALEKFGHATSQKVTYDYGIEFNQTSVYSVSALTNLMNNIIINHYLGLSANPNLNEARISVRSVPFKVKKEAGDLLTLKVLSNNLVTMGTQFTSMVSIVFAILGIIVGTSIAGDYEKKIVYQLQRVGVPARIFLASDILFEFGRFTVPSCLMAILVALFQVPYLKGPFFGIFMFALLIQGWISVLVSCLVSKLFRTQASAKWYLPLIMILAVIVPNFSGSILRALYAVNPAFTKIGNCILLLSPLSVISSIIIGIADAQADSNPISSMMHMDYAGFPLVVLFFYFLMALVALVMIEKKKAQISISRSDEKGEKWKGQLLPEISTTDNAAILSEEDVSEDNAVVLEQLWKRYPKAERRAVVGASLNVPKGTCLGLLGPSGAGKSTTIGMIIGDVSPSGGRYYLSGESAIGSNRDDLYERVRLACCLQTDSLFDELTVKEHVELYLSVRNHKDDYNERNLVLSILTRMRLLPHANKLTKQLSGGNKRKLCTALATLVITEIVVLDEPCTGCDPMIRRTLWEVIKQEQSSKSLILSIDSVDEAEALCNRIAIMINGQVVSYGTTQALRAQCAGTYELKIWLPAVPSFDAEQALIYSITAELLRPAFPAAGFIQKHTTHSGSICLTFDLGHVPLPSQAFDIAHQGFVQGKYTEFSVSPTTLGSAYQRLVRQQFDESVLPPSPN